MKSAPFVDDLTDEVCRVLLGSHNVGRVAFIGDDGFPLVLPVNYLIDGEDIVLQTSTGETFEHVPMHRVAFEVDQFDESAQTGWSVLAKGEARDVTDSVGEIYAMGMRRAPCVWAPGERHHWLAIRIDQLSGRQIVRPISADG
jgi:uncharacterized protein